MCAPPQPLGFFGSHFSTGPPAVAPGGEAAGHVRDRLQAHVLRGLGGERRTETTGAVKDEFLVCWKAGLA